MAAAILITGFEPFGGFPHNPSAEVVQALDGTEIAGHRIVGRILAVDIARHRPALEELLRQTAPALYLGFGLDAGEDMIRIERRGVNLADFPLPDNTGARLSGLAIEPAGEPARAATLPCAAIRTALIAAGIPARLSDSAGAYLCNAVLYTALGLCAGPAPVPLCGFIHLPHATHHVAAMLRAGGAERGTDPAAAIPSLAIETMIAAARIAIAVSVG
jgi:pyroglutamyl-peptidase